MSTVATQEFQLVRTPAINQALHDLTTLIVDSFPETAFDVQVGHDAVGYDLTAYLADFEQALAVLAVTADRQLEIQVDEDLAVSVDLAQQEPSERGAAISTNSEARMPSGS